MSADTLDQGQANAGSGDAPTPFWAQGRLGRSSRWLYLVSFLLIAGLYVGASIGLLLAVEALAPDLYLYWDVRDWREVPLMTALFGFTFFLATFVLLLLAAFSMNWLIHGRSPRTLITANEPFRWAQMAASFSVIFLLGFATLGLTLLISPGAVVYVLDLKPFLAFLPLVLVLVPLQVLAEEVVFRGYLLQLVGRFTGLRLVLLLLPASLFWAAHLENEPVYLGGIWAILGYAAIALYLTFLALACNGLEHAIGVHLGVNLYAFLIEGVGGSWYPTPTVVLITDLDFRFSLLTLIAALAIHYWLLVRPGRAEVASGS